MSPNQALQRTRLRVTACAPNRPHLSTHRHRPRRSGVSLSLASLGVFRAPMKMLSLIFVGWALIPFVGMAMPPSHTVTRQKAVIETIHPADPKAGTVAQIDVRCLDQNSKPTKQIYWMSFSNPTAIKALSRSRGAQTITFGNLRVGQELIFSGTAQGPLIVPDRCVIYLP